MHKWIGENMMSCRGFYMQLSQVNTTAPQDYDSLALFDDVAGVPETRSHLVANGHSEWVQLLQLHWVVIKKVNLEP